MHASLLAAFLNYSFISEEIGHQWSPHHGHIHKMDEPETSQCLSFLRSGSRSSVLRSFTTACSRGVFDCYIAPSSLLFLNVWKNRFCLSNTLGQQDVYVIKEYLKIICGKKTAGKRVCVECSLFHQESCTQILRNELSQLTGTFSLLNNHCSLIGTTPASSSALASFRTFRLPQQEEKPSLLAPCKAQQQQGKHFLHCCC